MTDNLVGVTAHTVAAIAAKSPIYTPENDKAKEGKEDAYFGRGRTLSFVEYKGANILSILRHRRASRIAQGCSRRSLTLCASVKRHPSLEGHESCCLLRLAQVPPMRRARARAGVSKGPLLRTESRGVARRSASQPQLFSSESSSLH